MTTLPSDNPEGSRADYFATTHWSVVLRAGQAGSPQAELALNELCKRYWYPLYVFTRHQGSAHAEAEDLVQGFFAGFLKKNYLAPLRKEHGRFRAFLLACLKNHLANERTWAKRIKRGGGAEHLPIDWASADDKYQNDLVHTAATSENSFDRAWVTTLLERVLTRLAEEKRARGNSKLFDVLKPFLMVAENSITYAAAATRLQMTEGAVRVATSRLRNRYQELLRTEIAETCDPALVDEEMRSLFQAFSN